MSGSRDDRLIAALGALAVKGKELRFCVVGAGHGGMAMAGHLAIQGYPVTLFNRSDDHLAGVRWHGGIAVDGEVNGFGKIELATSDIAEALAAADVVMVVTPSTAHRELAERMASHLRFGQVVVLNPGRTGGALEFSKTLADLGASGSAVVAEAQTFVYASRAVSRHEAHIFKIKEGVALAALPSYLTPPVLDILNGPFPQFKAGGNVLATSLENIGAVFHPALTILNAGWIEETKGDFEYYLQGITPSVALILERVDAERLAVARSLGLRNMSAVEWLYLSYGSPGKNLYEAIHNTAAYSGIRAPATIEHRYIFEDVPMSLVPIASLGAALGVRTPTIDMVIDLGNILHRTDFRAIGRTAEKLGVAGLSVKEILRLVV
jgi:opine dehydrogenase